MNRPCVSNQSQPHDVVEATGWLKMSIGVGKSSDAMPLNRGSILPEEQKIEETGVYPLSSDLWNSA